MRVFSSELNLIKIIQWNCFVFFIVGFSSDLIIDFFSCFIFFIELMGGPFQESCRLLSVGFIIYETCQSDSFFLF
ncbi:hypothetical protein BS639_23105 [Rouxiella silvae]|uniref:Uncharacterized protein n=1 Tax=Rouxiella silvae TaxID=1646373 RepID=A0ABX3TUK8_9GAMM|nr:hypothetical protein BS639_23105 [Rouxiella silvae]